MPRPRAAGFTLIELLVALAIFAVMSGIAYSGLAAVVRAREHLEIRSRELGALQLTVGLLERDLRQAVARPIRDRYGEARGALIGGRAGFEVSTLAASSPRIANKPTVGRVGYAFADGKLARIAWPVLDRTPASAPAARELLDGIERLELRYLDRGNQWIDAWPPARSDVATLETLPRAVEVRLMLAAGGQVTRLIELPDAVEARLSGPAPPGGTK
jgi:general secretion pathway protein J